MSIAGEKQTAGMLPGTDALAVVAKLRGSGDHRMTVTISPETSPFTCRVGSDMCNLNQILTALSSPSGLDGLYGGSEPRHMTCMLMPTAS